MVAAAVFGALSSGSQNIVFVITMVSRAVAALYGLCRFLDHPVHVPDGRFRGCRYRSDHEPCWNARG
jgi:hypothetical protein